MMCWLWRAGAAWSAGWSFMLLACLVENRGDRNPWSLLINVANLALMVGFFVFFVFMLLCRSAACRAQSKVATRKLLRYKAFSIVSRDRRARGVA